MHVLALAPLGVLPEDVALTVLKEIRVQFFRSGVCLLVSLQGETVADSVLKKK